jgi:hypothetical protein
MPTKRRISAVKASAKKPAAAAKGVAKARKTPAAKKPISRSDLTKQVLAELVYPGGPSEKY